MPTPDTIQGIDLPTYDDPPAIPDDLAAIFYALMGRGVPRFSNDAQRDAAYPAPTDGQLAWVQATRTLHIVVDGDWRIAWCREQRSVATLGDWETFPGYPSPATRLEDERIFFDSTTLRIKSGVTPGSVSNGTTLIVLPVGSVDTPHRPAAPARGFATIHGSTAAYVVGDAYIGTDGSLRVVAGATLTLTTSSYITLTTIQWPKVLA